MTIDEMIDVLQAAKEGKTIEQSAKSNPLDKGWCRMAPDQEFNFALLRYRVKPEPREIWVGVHKEGHVSHAAYISRAICEIHHSDDGWRPVRFREVIE